MRRRAFDLLLSSTGMVLTIVLLVAGGLLYWGYSFANSNVHDQLAAQKILFPPKGSQALAPPEIGRYLNQYAGQQLVNGAQAQAYANHFVAVHLKEAAGGKTYAQVSSLALQNPNDAKLAGQVQPYSGVRPCGGAAAERLRVLEGRTDRAGGQHRLVRAGRGDAAADGAGVLAPAPGGPDRGADGSHPLAEDPRACLRPCNQPRRPRPPDRRTGGIADLVGGPPGTDCHGQGNRQ